MKPSPELEHLIIWLVKTLTPVLQARRSCKITLHVGPSGDIKADVEHLQIQIGQARLEERNGDK